MVNEEVVNYLVEGQKRGNSLDILKKNLLNGGFDEPEINEALIVANNRMGLGQNFGRAVGSMPNSPSSGFGGRQIQENREEYYGIKWMKIAGIMGTIFLVLVVLLFIGIYIPQIMELWVKINSNKVGNIVVYGILLIMNFLFFLGFFRLGKFSEFKLVKVSSIFVIVLLFIGIVGGLLMGLFISEQDKGGSYTAGSVLSMAPEDFSSIGNTGNLESSNGFSLISSMDSESKLIFISILIYLFLSVIAYFLLGIGLIKMKADLKLPVASGISFLIFAGFWFGNLAYFGYSAVVPISADISALGGLFKMMFMMMIMMYVFIFNLLYIILFGSLTMFEGSRKYEG